MRGAVAPLVDALCYSLKVLGSIPNDGTEFFNCPNPFGRIVILWSTQPLTGFFVSSVTALGTLAATTQITSAVSVPSPRRVKPDTRR
jgi:hypothetical protein